MGANELVHGPHNGVQKLLAATGLVDETTYFHGDDTPKTYLRGQHRIDYMFVSPDLLPCLHRSGHIVILDGLSLDHVSCWIEFDGTQLFQDATETHGSIQHTTFPMRDTMQLHIF